LRAPAGHGSKDSWREVACRVDGVTAVHAERHSYRGDGEADEERSKVGGRRAILAVRQSHQEQQQHHCTINLCDATCNTPSEKLRKHRPISISMKGYSVQFSSLTRSLIITRAVLSEGGPRDAAVNFDRQAYQIFQQHRAVSLPQHAFLNVGLCLQTAVDYLSQQHTWNYFTQRHGVWTQVHGNIVFDVPSP